MAQWIGPADDAARIALSLIAAYHPDLAEARILYLFTSARRKKCDRVRLGSAQRLSTLQRYLSRKDRDDAATEVDFIILLSFSDWNLMTEMQQIALVDHELCHCGVRLGDSGDRTYYLKGHDIEEFADIIKRHGLWKPDLEETAKAIGDQLSLFEEAVS
jgi:hypothetical protein